MNVYVEKSEIIYKRRNRTINRIYQDCQIEIHKNQMGIVYEKVLSNVKVIQRRIHERKLRTTEMKSNTKSNIVYSFFQFLFIVTIIIVVLGFELTASHCQSSNLPYEPSSNSFLLQLLLQEFGPCSFYSLLSCS
jgi:hypothetical protein